MISNERTINKYFFILFALLGGTIGLDRFARGQIALGVIKLITLGGVGIWYTIDACIAAYKSFTTVGDEVTFVNGKWA